MELTNLTKIQNFHHWLITGGPTATSPPTSACATTGRFRVTVELIKKIFQIINQICYFI
jgi:hypothetical protein